MNFPQKAYDNVVALYEKDKLLGNAALAKGDDRARRQLTRMIAEQNCFDLGPDWGTKSTSSNADQSKDGIAFRTGPGSMDVWDWQNGTTREVQVNAGDKPDYPNITDQFFIQVNPFNHLAKVPGEVPDDDPGDIPGDTPGDEPPPEALLLMQILSVLSELVTETKIQTTTFKTGLAELKAEISKGIKIKF